MEMLAIVDCLEKFKSQLTGTKFEILTDHAPLTHWKTQKDLSPWQIRWNETLSRFDAEIHRIPGITNSAADALARYPYVQSQEDLFARAVSQIKLDTDILETVKKSYANDSLFGPVIQNPERYSLYQFEDALIFFKDDSESLPMTVHHAKSVFKHSTTVLGIISLSIRPVDRLISTIIGRCYNEMASSISNPAHLALEKKSSTQAPAGFLDPLPIPKDRFAEIALDFVGSLVPSKGFGTVLVMTD